MSTERNTLSAANAPVYTVKEVSRLLHTNPAFVYRIINLGARAETWFHPCP